MSLAVGCVHDEKGGGDDDDGSTETPTPTPTATPGTFADFSNAVAIGLQETGAAASPAQLGPAGPSCYETMPTGQLVSVDANGNTAPLLNQPYEAAYFLVTSSNVIVRGAGLVEEVGTGVQFNCCILAIPRSPGISPVACLSTVTPHFATGPRDLFDRTGIASSNDTIYFSEGDPTGGGVASGNVMRWDGSSGFVETVLHVDGLGALYASGGAENICGIGCDGTDCTTLCGRPGVGFQVMDPFGTNNGYFQIGSSVWDGQTSIDLATLAKVPTDDFVNFGYQSNRYKHVLPDGSHLGIAQVVSQTSVFVVRLTPPNHVQLVDTVASEPWNWEHLVAAENWAVVSGKLYGPPHTDNIRFVDLTTFVVGSANQMAALDLLQVSGMSFAAPTVLEVDGTGTNGLETSVFIDAVTGEVTQEPPPEAQFIQIRYIQ